MICTATMNDNRCTRQAGHEGSHGIEIAPGLVLAPWQGSDEPGTEPPESTELRCDCCQTLLILHRKGRTFACPKCDQRHMFPDATTHFSTICAWLYPSFERMTLALKRECLAFHVESLRFAASARLLLGDISQEEFEQLNAESSVWYNTEIAKLYQPVNRMQKFRALLVQFWNNLRELKTGVAAWRFLYWRCSHCMHSSDLVRLSHAGLVRERQWVCCRCEMEIWREDGFESSRIGDKGNSMKPEIPTHIGKTP
jgi:hypothetical protein